MYDLIVGRGAQDTARSEQEAVDIISKYNLLDQAHAYILQLKERIERLKTKKKIDGKDHKRDRGTDDTIKLGFKLPVIEVRNQESNLEVLLISDSEKRFSLYQLIGILQEEGAEVVNANFSIVGDKIFYTIHSRVIKH
ncbi:hypothetical protein MA16_Dca028133 [Dendrobium catenatum]|uniref:Uncharacterized protein n=1 Tax=Dendrobium catenatum TaxID=906689 RepID=A0A2I0VDZ1_9ASPA|nr:hypothetical protein MA16_Dca028133 [Dendrobium catenatum]